MNQKSTLSDLQKTVYPRCIFHCVQNIHNNAFRCSNEQRTSVRRDSKEKAHPKWEVIQRHSHHCPHRLNSYTRLIYLHQTNVVWSEIITQSLAPRVRMLQVAEEQKLRAEGTHLLWLHSSTVWSQFPLWGNGWGEAAQGNLAARTRQPLGPRLLRLPCKSSRAHFRKHGGSGRRWLLRIEQVALLLLSSLFSLPQSLMRTSAYKCYHLCLPPSWRRKVKVLQLYMLETKYQESAVYKHTSY